LIFNLLSRSLQNFAIGGQVARGKV